MKTFRDYLNQIDGVTGPREGDALDLVINEEIVLEADVVDRDGNNVFIGMDNLSYQMLEEAGIVEASWRDIYNLNKGVIGGDPNKIKPGQVLKMPDGSSYTVKTGDNLTKIAGGAGGQQAAQPAADAAASASTASAPVATDAESLRAAQDAAAGKEPAAAQTPDAMAGADAGDQKTSSYTGQDIKSPDQPATQDAMAPAPATSGDTASSQASADLDRLKQLAVGQPTQNQAGSDVGRGYQAAASPATSQAAQPAAAAPAASGTPNPWEGKDPAKAAAWASLSPEDQKWIGKADPTDKNILARAPSKGGFLGSITPGFMKQKTVTPPAAQGVQSPQPPAGQTSFVPDSTKSSSGGQTAAVPTPQVGQPQPLDSQAAQPKESTEHAEQMLAEDFVRMMELAGIDIKKKELNEQGIFSKIGQQLKNIVPKSKPPAPRVPPGGSAAPLTPRPSAPKPKPKAQTVKQVEAEAKKELLRLEVETKKLELEAARRNLPPSELKKALIALGKGSADVAGKIITWPFNNPWKAISATIAGSLVMAYANSPEDSLAKWIGAEGTKIAIDALQGAGGTVAQTHPESPVADIARKLGVAPPQEYKEMSAAKQEQFKDWVWWTAIGEKTVQDAPGELQKPIATMLPALQGKSREEIVTILDNLPDTKPGGKVAQSGTLKSSGGSSSAQPAAPANSSTTAPAQPSLTPQQGAETGGAPNSSVREGLRYYTRNPHSGKIVEVYLNSAPAAGRAHTVENRLSSGLSRQGRSTWHLDAWSEIPISKIMKGKK